MVGSGRVYVLFVLLFCLCITVNKIMFIKMSGCCGDVVILAIISNFMSKTFRGRTPDYGIATGSATSENAGLRSN